MSTPAGWLAIWGRAKERAQAPSLITVFRISFLTGLAEPTYTTSTQQQYREPHCAFGRRRHGSFQMCEATTALCSLPLSLGGASSGNGHAGPRPKNDPSPMAVRERIMECWLRELKYLGSEEPTKKFMREKKTTAHLPLKPPKENRENHSALAHRLGGRAKARALL